MNEETMTTDETYGENLYDTEDVLEEIPSEKSDFTDADECENSDCTAELDIELAQLEEEFPELIKTRKNVSPERYAQLRSLGLSTKEAYLATSEAVKVTDTRSHLRASAPIVSKRPATGMTRAELEAARELFEGMSDAEILRLYKKVTK